VSGWLFKKKFSKAYWFNPNLLSRILSVSVFLNLTPGGLCTDHVEQGGKERRYRSWIFNLCTS